MAHYITLQTDLVQLSLCNFSLEWLVIGVVFFQERHYEGKLTLELLTSVFQTYKSPTLVVLVVFVLLVFDKAACSLSWPATMQIYWSKRKFLHRKKVQLPKDWFGTLGTPTWPPFHCFGTPIWPP